MTHISESGLKPLGNNRYQDAQGYIFVRVVRPDGRGHEFIDERDQEDYENRLEMEMEEA